MQESFDTIALSEVRLIGEYTTDHGPGVDDWFLVVLTSDGWFEASIPSVEAKRFQERFEKQVCALGEMKLYSSTEWKSRVLWPAEILGKPWLNIEPLDRRSFVSKLKSYIGINEIQVKLRDEIVDWMNRS